MESAEPARPDPDRLLRQVQAAEAHGRRGRLKIYLGAAPGVGKTFAMLSAARRRLAQGHETVVGCVETHGRAETAVLLQGLEVLPLRSVEYRGTALREFDLEAALRRRPALLLVDELAHTNVPGSRFAKRWQDVEALLEAGIDVDTTLNVQHLESQNDLVAQVTGVQVRETVPDRVVDRAQEVVLVDLPPDALLERLRTGRVYVPEVARHAVERFFTKGNLTALRELALRRTAQWVDGQLQAWRRDQGVERVWGTGERILVAVGPSPLSARLVRAAHRTARGLHAELLAVFVEEPGRPLPPALRDRVTAHLRLAESLGARTATIEANDPATAVVAFARAHDVARIVVGKSGRTRWQELLFGSFPIDVIRRSGDIDVHVIRGAEDEPAAAGARDAAAHATAEPRPAVRELAMAAAVVGVAALVALSVHEPGDLSIEAMVLILGIVVVSLRCSRMVAIAAVFGSAAAFNFLFTEPRFTFTITDPGYVVAFVVMLVIGLVVTSLVSRAREGTARASRRERETVALYSLVRELADADSETAVARVVVGHLRDVVGADFVVLVPPADGACDAGCVLASHGVPDWLGPAEFGVAKWCFDHGRAAGAGTDHLPGCAGSFLPMIGQHGRIGVLAVPAAAASHVLAPGKRSLVTTFSEQAARAIERLRLRQAQLLDQRAAATERLRSTLLASVSHDLRTPLATIVGAASSLLDETGPRDAAARAELVDGILHEARRLDDLVGNLVFATRLEAGEVTLRREWTSVEEVIGSALQRAQPQLRQHPVAVRVAPQLPLLQADPVLLEQAVFLLLDNAARHTPVGTPLRIGAWATDAAIVIEVHDDGPGVPVAARDDLFERFVRGRGSSGMGLGLAICAAIAKVHGGSVVLAPATAAGATFHLSLPLAASQPPAPAELPAGGDAARHDPEAP